MRNFAHIQAYVDGIITVSEAEVRAAMRAIVEGVEAEIGERFFHSLVKQLAAALRVRYAFVSEINEEQTSFHTLAV